MLCYALHSLLPNKTETTQQFLKNISEGGSDRMLNKWQI